MEDNNYRIEQALIVGSELHSDDILFDLYKSICLIEYLQKSGKTVIGSGFLIKLNKKGKDFFCLMSNEHVITKNIIEEKTYINISYNKKEKKIRIKLDGNERFIKKYTYLGLDIVVIEIFLNEIKEEYFLLPFNKKDYNLDDFKNKTILVIQYPQGGLSHSYGLINMVNEFSNEILHLSSTSPGSSGSPIFLSNSKKVLGIHKQGDSKNQINYGNFIEPVVNSIYKDLKYGKKKYNNRIYEGEYVNEIKDGYGKILYNNGGFYIGNWVNYEKVGKGILYYKKDNPRYEGEFSADLFNGQGKLIEENGEYYIGNFIEGLKFGNGIEYYKNNSIKYEGEFDLGKYNGFGKYNFIGKANTFFYIGNFIMGKMKGQCQIYANKRLLFEGDYDNFNTNGGKIYIGNGEYYIGDLRNGFKEGKGKIVNSNNEIIYEGDFLNNNLEGEGKMYHNDVYYSGEFKKNVPDGQGKIFDENENLIFDGNFKNGKALGKAIIFDKNNNIKFNGNYKNNKKNGYGIYNEGNMRYEGYFVDNKFDGEGKIFRDNRLLYAGELKEGKMNGFGTLYDNKGNIKYIGHFINNEKYGEEETENFENDCYYIGNFVNNKKNGHGKIFNNKNEIIFDGEFMNDKKNGYGTEYFRDFDLYIKGNIKDGEFHGFVEIYFIENNYKYGEGYFNNGKIEGKLKIFRENGEIEFIEFDNLYNIVDRLKYRKHNTLDKIIDEIKECIIF